MRCYITINIDLMSRVSWHIVTNVIGPYDVYLLRSSEFRNRDFSVFTVTWEQIN